MEGVSSLSAYVCKTALEVAKCSLISIHKDTKEKSKRKLHQVLPKVRGGIKKF